MVTELNDGLQARAAVHAALGDPARLAIVEALSLSDASPSELRELFGLESNLLAHHLDVLSDAGLVERIPSHADRRRRYLRLRVEALESLSLVVPVAASRVVFVCTANSARSQLAAALWKVGHEVVAVSGGTEPAEAVHPQAVKAARRRGLDLSTAKPAAFRAPRSAKELVVTVCDRAHEQLRRRPARPGRWLHWSIADPAEVGTARAFDEAVVELDGRITALAAQVVPASAGRSSR